MSKGASVKWAADAMSDSDVELFGAMMFVAGANRTAGGTVEDLATINPEQFREAREIAAREFPQFKKRIKERRKKGPVS